MIRYRIDLGVTEGFGSRSPAFADPLDTEEYYGTIVIDFSIESNLPVIHLFIEDPEVANTNVGTKAHYITMASSTIT